jgi:hypothetical protein
MEKTVHPDPVAPDLELEKKRFEKDRDFKQACRRYSRIRARGSR